MSRNTKPVPSVVPCLWFNGQAEEAAGYYVGVFKEGSIGQISHYGQTGPGEPGSVLTVDFELRGQRFTALNGGPDFTFTEAVSFQISCADQDEVDWFWSRLAQGGEEGPCGWLKDRYGLSWQVVPTELETLLKGSNPTRANAVMTAMLAMGKLDLAALRAARDDA